MWAMICLRKCTPGEEGRGVERSYVNRANFEDYPSFLIFKQFSWDSLTFWTFNRENLTA